MPKGHGLSKLLCPAAGAKPLPLCSVYVVLSKEPHPMKTICTNGRKARVRAFVIVAPLTAFLLVSIYGYGQSDLRPWKYNHNAETYELNRPGYSLVTARCTPGEFVSVAVRKGETYQFSTCGISWNSRLELREATPNGLILATDEDGCGQTDGAAQLTWLSTVTGKVLIALEESGNTVGSRHATLTLTWMNNGSDEPLVQQGIGQKKGALFPEPAETTPAHLTASADHAPAACPGVAHQYTYLQALTAEFDLGKVSLRWNTLSEENTTEFIVERSSDGIVFTPIGSVKASGHSDEPHQYGVADFAPPFGKVHYRLLLPGQSEALHAKTAQIDTGGNLEVNGVFPCAASPGLVVSVNSAEERQLVLQVSDISGRNVLTQYLHTAKGFNHLPLHERNLPPGVYTLEVREFGKGPVYKQEISKT